MKILSLKLPLLSSSLKNELANFLPKTFHSCLEGLDPFHIKAPVIGVGIIQKGHVKAAAFATIHTKIHSAQIHFIGVKNKKNASYLISVLLNKLETRLIAHDIAVATFVYAKEDSATAFLEKNLIKNQWKGPTPFMIECLFKSVDFDPPWWHKKIDLEEDFEEFLFTDLTKDEQKDIIHRMQQMSIPNYVQPFAKSESMEKRTSLGLRYKGKIIGWMITHRIDPDILRYSALFLEEDFSQTRLWLKLLIDAIRIHTKKTDIPYGMLEINLEQISSPWFKFIQKRLFPHACHILHKQKFWKNYT